jgi:hypothetical protein
MLSLAQIRINEANKLGDVAGYSMSISALKSKGIILVGPVS